MFYHFKMFHKALCKIFVIFCLFHATKALRGPVRQWQKLSSPPETKAYPEQLHSQILDHFDATNPGYSENYKGPPQLKKIPKISASGRNFLDPLPPSSKKGPTDKNVGISYLIVIIKFGFFRVSNPSPPISSES